jgi:hypothetical protein
MSILVKIPKPPAVTNLLCAVFLATFALEGDAAVELRPVVRNTSAAAPHGVIVLRHIPDAQTGDKESPKREVAFTGDPVIIDEAPGSRWDVSMEAAGYWSPLVMVTMPQTGQSRAEQIPIWKTTTLHGRLRVPAKDAAPKVMTLAVESPPQPSKRPEIGRGTRFDCDLAEEGAWTCTVPATTLDVAIRIKGYAPVYRWGVALTPEKSGDLGEMQLQKGASVLAWLDPDTAKLLTASARATLTRMIRPDASLTTARLGAPVGEAAFDSRGAAQLVGLPPGTYVLTVTAKGFAPARAFPIEVFAGSETALRKPMTLERPMTIRVTVRPPKDPSGAPWLVGLRRGNDFGTGYDPQAPVRVGVNERGLVEVPDQAPGSFQATISDHTGSVYVRRDLDLHDPNRADTVIDVPIVAVRGKILLGDVPLPSDLWFGGRHGSVSVKLTANEDGAFDGALPKDGEWTVEVAGRSPKLETVTHVSVGSDDLLIRIPDTIVKGLVVDPDRGPVDRIEVSADAAGRSAVVRANSDGTFVFRGLPEETVNFRAVDLRTGRHSKDVQASLKAGDPSDVIRLRIEPDHPVTGYVLSRGAPVIGARVTAMAFIGASSIPQVRAVSNEQGAFDLQLPEAAQHAWIVVGAAGRTLQSYDVALAGEPLTLELEPVGGSLILSWPQGNLPNVARAGVPLMLPDLTGWARAQGQVLEGQHLRVPNVAPGPYRACTMVPVKKSDGARPETRCTEGVLAPGGTLTLDLGS